MRSGMRLAGDETGPARQALRSRQKVRKRLSQSAGGSVNGPQTTWRPGRRLIAGAGVAVGELKRWNGEGAEIASGRAMLTKSPARERYDSVAGEDASVSASVNVCWELIVFWLLLQRLRKRPAETDGVWGELERSGQRGGRDIPARSRGGGGRWSGQVLARRFSLACQQRGNGPKQNGQCSFMAGQDHGSSAVWRRPYKASGRPTLRSQFTSAPCLVVRG